MASNRQRPLSDLQVPVPSFPLSSPISEEISSPSCSSSEDRELERNRPFEFLVKATKQKVENRSAKDASRSPNLPHRDKRAGEGPRMSIRGITKKRKNAAKPVGLNVVTDFSMAAPKKRPDDTTAPFVDLHDLKLLSKAREKERSAQKAKGLFKRRPSRGFQRLPDETSEAQTGSSCLAPSPEHPGGEKLDHGLSPSDRHVMIGLTVPCSESLDRTKELDSAGEQNTPLTPSIIITPAQEEAPWPTSSPETLRPRAASSIYSQPTPRLWQTESDIPPVPAIPALHSVTKNANSDPDLLRTRSSAATRKQRSLSTDTVFEEDSPQQTRPSRSPADENDQGALSRLSVNTETNRPQSQGWWTYLLSPLLGKKSPTSPDAAAEHSSAARPTQESSKDWWEKEVSCFSPETPETAVTNRWHDGEKSLEQTRSLGNSDESAAVPNRQNMASFMFPGRPIQGEAAEYYQACAHELFSKTPYFECCNHVCSITPVRDAVVGGMGAAAGVPGDRGLVLVEADPPNAGVGESRGMTTDSGTTGDSGNTKGAQSLISDTDSDSWSSPVVGDHEKSLPAPPQSAAKEAVSTTPAQETPSAGPTETSEKQVPGPLAPPAQVISDISPPVTHVHYPPPDTQLASQPAVAAEKALPHYIAIFPPNHGAVQAQSVPQERSQVSELSKAPAMPPGPPQGSEWPQEQQRASQASEPISPGFQQAAGGAGSIPLSAVRAPAPAYTQFPREAALPPRYDLHPPPGAAAMDPTAQRGPMEARRRRLEREDAVGRTVGGLWRGRGPFSNKGCFGRPGREGRLRRRWYLAIAAFFLIIVVLAIALATTLTRKGDLTPVQSQWLNLTGYPPMPTGIATVAGSEPQVQKSTCITPSSLWSCALPKEQQSANQPYEADEPSFRVEIRFRNGTYDNSTDTVSTKSTRKFRISRDNGLFNPSPSPPSLADQTFLGNTTDGNTAPYAGEETPFFMSILSPVPISSTNLFRRSSSDTFPNLTAIIPAPDENSNGTAAAATLYPLPESQPVRLYNRGEPTEHYGFYTYFDRSIFLESLAVFNGSSSDDEPNDTNGGSSETNAQARCTWSQTRFLVQIWTQPARLGRTLVSSSNSSTSTVSAATPTSTSTPTSFSSATDFTRPGSFPYPMTITLDRHGGAAKQKLVYCYAVQPDGHFNITDRKLQIEDRGFGGALVNPASGIFDDLNDDGADGDSSSSSPSSSSSSGPSWGGIDGGTGGCACQWTNWVSTG